MAANLEHINKVLLIRRKALGDCLVTLPAVRQLAERFPSARLDLIIDRPFAHLISLLAPEINVIAWSAKNQGFTSSLAWYRHLWNEKYDLVIDWLGNPRTALWSAATGAPLRVGYDLPRRRWAYNVPVPRNRRLETELRGFAGEAFLDPLRALGLDPEPWQPGPVGPWAGIIDADELGSQYRSWRQTWFADTTPTVAMMMSATWPAKAWPVRHIVDLGQLLIDQGYRPLLIPGPGDEAMVLEVGRGLPPQNIAPATTLPELADLLLGCRAFAGTDCGGRHLAACLGLPTVTVFGPTDADGWNPGHPRHVSIRMDLECLGCDLKTCPLPGRPCLEELPASKVLDGLLGLLNPEIGGSRRVPR